MGNTEYRRAMITIEAVPEHDRWGELWSLYLRAFEPLQSLALLNHLYPRADFDALLAEPRVQKFIAWNGQEPTGLAMLTNALDLVPQISPPFLHARFPEQASREAVFFGIMVFVDEAHRRSSLFARLVAGMGQVTAEQAGVVVFDICRHNLTAMELETQMRGIARWFPGSTFSEIDRQSYFGVDLPQPIDQRVKLPLVSKLATPDAVYEPVPLAAVGD